MAKSKMKLAEILKGCTPGKIQSVGVMQVIPLVSNISDDKFVSPNQSSMEVSTSNYGTLVFKNQSDKTAIIPPQAGYVVKQSAQDHALPHVGVVEGKKTTSFDDAMCIQQSQGGTISGGEHNMLILPFPLREKAHKVRNNRGFDRLWRDISTLNNRAGVKSSSGSAHLEYFLDSFKEQLDRFVAEFETVDKQVGAIILINGRVVGVERTPSYTYWNSIWSALIRECYGSLAIIEANDYNNKVPPTRVPLRKATSVSDLKNALKEASDEEYARVKKIVNDIADIDMGQKVDNTVGDVDIEELSSKRFIGQIVRKGDTVVYASLVATKEWRDNEEWNEAESFEM